MELAQYEKLLAGGLVLNVEAQLINVDSNCPVVIDSLNEAECTTMLTTDSTVINSTLETLILSIVISLSTVVILMIFTIIIVIIAVMHRKRKSSNMKDVT